MEEEDAQNSNIEPEMFNIPYEQYEEYIDANLNEEILDLLVTHNQIRSQLEFEEIEDKLYGACKEGDIELIKIYLNETIVNTTKGLEFKIDKTNKTASLFKVNDRVKHFIVPRTVQHESVEYLITSITGTNQCIKTIKFDENSEVKTIYSGTFLYSQIEEIYFPASLRELKEGWCRFTNKLTKIIISPLNGQFVFKDDKYLLGKTDPKSDEFDNLLFVRRDIKEFSVPSNIKIISSFAFYNCKNLTKIEIPPNSNLQTIGSNAFTATKIEEIYFPASLRELKEDWCCYIDNLTKVIISPLNGQFVFKDNKYLLGKTDPKSDEFDNLLFVRRDINEISIPSNIKIISSFALTKCENLTKVEFSPNSNLQTIGSNSFQSTNIEEIVIPSKVLKMCKYAFDHCNNLIKVEISQDSNLQKIESYTFAYSKIKEIFIPPKVTKICGNAFFNCNSLVKIEIPPNSNLQTIGSDAFTFLNIKEIFIPPKVTKICQKAFYNCTSLVKVEIPPNSNLQIIGPNAFTYSNIKNIFIPQKVIEICEYAFYHCRNLQIIEISEESELESFPLSALYGCEKVRIMLPS